MKKLLIVVLALVFAVSLSVGQAFAISYCKDALEAGNTGGPSSPKTFDDTIQLEEGTQKCIDIWVNDIPNPTLLTSRLLDNL